MATPRNIVVLTGAGISAESGLKTFRAEDGLWEGQRVEDVATPEGFAADPALVQRFYDERRAQVLTASPNAAHYALGRLERVFGGELLLVTQNVDDLHERGGAGNVLHMHGEVLKAWCLACDSRMAWHDRLSDQPPCPVCQKASLRPDIVWFGEMPYGMDRSYRALARCDLFVSIGTSGAVYPAAGFVEQARAAGAATLELNLERSLGSDRFDESRLGSAGTLVPEWVEQILAP